jgi:cellulose synthase/poly-beta-1,6-N-acetylglucosamine synthase-like glycosyltransferase
MAMDQSEPEPNALTPVPTGEALKEEQDSTDLPAIQTEPISVLLPILNDRVNLQSSLENWISVLNNLNRDYEILLVDDASNDGTLDLAQSLAEKNPRVQVLRHESHDGFGACLRTGLAAAQYPLLLICTCDGRYQPAEITHLLQWIDKVHVVAGYRTVASKRYKRNWSERIFRWIIRIIFGLRLKDPECWFLLARRSIFERIPVQSTGPFAFPELLAKANFLGCLMTDVAVSYHPMSEADTKWSNISLGQKLTGFRQIFFHPEFGPPKV